MAGGEGEEMGGGDYELPDHPALKNFNPAAEKVGHVFKRGGKFAAVLGVALPLVVGTAVLAGLVGLGWVGLALGVGTWAAFGLGGVGGALLGLAAVGAVAGFIIGAATSDPQRAVDDKAEKLMSNYQRGEVRQERKDAVAYRTELQRMELAEQARKYGLNPNVGLPGGMASDGRQMA